MFTLKIKTDNAAFSDGARGAEIARILRDIARQVEDMCEGARCSIQDGNGNTVGEWRLTDRG